MGHLPLPVKSLVRESGSGGAWCPPFIKLRNYPNLQSVTQGSYKYLSYKNFFPYIKSMTGFTNMKKNFDKIFSTIEIDPVTDRYHMTIPEEIVNEFDWYEDLVLKWNIDSGEIYLTEADE